MYEGYTFDYNLPYYSPFARITYYFKETLLFLCTLDKCLPNLTELLYILWRKLMIATEVNFLFELQ